MHFQKRILTGKNSYVYKLSITDDENVYVFVGLDIIDFTLERSTYT